MSRRIIAFSIFLSALFPAVSFAAAPCPFSWERNLSQGARGADVSALQTFLAGNGGPVLPVTSYYGPMTARAVSVFQEAHAAEVLTPAGLARGTGRVGPLTRTKLNALCATAPSAAIPAPAAVAQVAQTNDLTVTAGEQPAAAPLPAGVLGIPFTTFALTAGSQDVTVTAITVRRSGPAMDGAFEGVGIVDEDDEDIADERRFTSDHLARFITDLVIPAGETKTFTVEGSITDDLTEYDGQMPSLEVMAVEASAPVAGILPIRGASHALVQSLEIGSASLYLGAYDPGVDSTRYINDTAVRFSGVRIEAGSREDIILDSITWEQSGTAGPHDIANVMTILDGVAYPMEADGRSYTATFPQGIRIAKGQSVQAHVQGDILVQAANRTIQFDLAGGDDVGVRGAEYGFAFEPGVGGNTAMSGGSAFLTEDGTTDSESLDPFFSGSVATVLGGTVVSIGR